LGQYDDAVKLYQNRIQNATLYRLSAGRQLSKSAKVL